MQRYLVHRYGGPDALRLTDADEPEPTGTQVRVAAHAIGINFADLIQRVGRYPRQPSLPFTPGMEAAGVVDAVGPDARAELLGKRVMAVPIYGSHAEKFCLDEQYVMEMPDACSFAEGAAFPVSFLTAEYALRELGRAKEGETCVVTAAAGGVGTAILQLAKLAGLRVMAVVGSERKRPLVLELGAEHVTDYETCAADVKRIWGGVDIVIDSVGGTFFRPHWKLLNLSGRYVLYGFAQVGSAEGISYMKAARGLISMGFIKPYDFTTSNLTLAGFNLSVLPNQVELLREYGGRLISLWADGTIKPILGKSFPFERLADAHRHLASRESTGRVIVTC